MNGIKRFVVLGAFLLGAADADKSAEQVVRSDAGHVGCYYGTWAYTRWRQLSIFLQSAETILLDQDWVSSGLRTLTQVSVMWFTTALAIS